MGDKVYKPIIKDGYHIIYSKDNPNRVRGLARDENNKNPDIIEWEECNTDDSDNYKYFNYAYTEKPAKVKSKSKKIARQVFMVALVAAGTILFQKFVYPWLKNTALPWIKEKSRSIKNTALPYIKEKSRSIKNTVVENSKQINATTAKTEIKKHIESAHQLYNISSQIDMAFEQFYIEMDEEEAKTHMARLVYHMLGVVNEIRIISNAYIRRNCESEKLCIEKQKEAEMFLSEKVAVGLNQLLSNENLRLDLNTSKELFSLTGGGIHLNGGEYIPVQATKIDETLKSLPVPNITNI